MYNVLVNKLTKSSYKLLPVTTDSTAYLLQVVSAVYKMRISASRPKKILPQKNRKPLNPAQDKDKTTKIYFPFIVQIAKRMTRRLPSHIAVEDMVSAGLVGLIDCIDRYDPQKSERFESYAEFRIRGAMLDELRASDPLSRDQRALINNFRTLQHQMEGQLGRPPTSAEIAVELGQNIDKYNKVIASLIQSRTSSVFEIESSLDACENVSFSNEVENQKLLNDCIMTLNNRLRMIVLLYYYCDMNLKEIGRVMSITESRVCQLHQQAMLQLRKLLIDGQKLRGYDFFTKT